MDYARLAIVLRAEEPVRLPGFKGAIIRGAFGYAFRRIACPFPKRLCSSCLLRDRCVYSLVFETPRPKDSRVMRKYETVPHPFLIESEFDSYLLPRRYEPGETLRFNLLLFGPAIEFLPYFIYAFEEMAAKGLGPGRGRLKLIAVEQEGRGIYSGPDQAIKAKVERSRLWLKAQAGKTDSVVLRLLTPVRIVYQHRIAQNLDFHVLFRALVRRIGLLSYFYSDKPFEIDYSGLIAQAQGVKTLRAQLQQCNWRRFSTRQDQSIDMSGLIGRLSYQGDMRPFLPYLRIGEIVHVGKGTAFGLGQIRLEAPDYG